MSEQGSLSTAGEPTGQMSISQYIGKLLANNRPPVVFAGPDLGSPDGKVRWKRGGVNEDEELLRKTEHVRRPNEKMMEFIARVGIGASQIREMDKSSIKSFVEAVEARGTDPVLETRIFEPRRVPPRFILTD